VEIVAQSQKNENEEDTPASPNAPGSNRNRRGRKARGGNTHGDTEAQENEEKSNSLDEFEALEK